MQRFVAKQNVDHYRHMLETEQDPDRRRQLEQMLAEAIAHLNEVEGHAPRSIYPPERPPR